jgi:tyrosyl-tRNA synthetase
MSQNFIDIIKERGFVHQMTDEEGLRELLKTPGQTAYIGFDCTAKSLHVGSLMQIMLLRWWQKCGNTPVILLGGGTTKVGDPSGKDEARKVLSDAQINENMNSLKQVFGQFIDHGKALTVNNAEWLDKLNYIDFLRNIAPHFSVNRMMTMDSVKLRLEREQNLSLLEFNYMVLQAYDFAHLNQSKRVRVQMGGSDQWGNIISGIDLNRRMGQREVYGITSPLLTTSSGAKMGKTAAGAVWLNADLLSPYDYWQFWRNTEDADVMKFLKLFTEIPLTEKERAASNVKWEYSIEQLAALEGAGINEAKKVLATEATAMLHGREAAERAAQTAADTFSGAGVSADLPEITAPSTTPAVVELLVLAGFAESNGEARRLIKGNGISVNDLKVVDEKHCLAPTDFAQGFAKLSKGKKQHVLVKLAPKGT